MQLPFIDKKHNLSTSSADAVSTAVAKVIPITPVNPQLLDTPVQHVQVGVVNHVGEASVEANFPTVGAPVYTSVADVNNKTAENAPHDWTIKPVNNPRLESPPPKPIAQILIDHLKTVWSASASAIQPEQMVEASQLPKTLEGVQPLGSLAKEALIYQPQKIKKSENL
jgi:hypothetical protein